MKQEGHRPGRLVVLVHHADAVPPHVDAQRPLSERGRAQADWLARRAMSEGVKPAAIMHSGKLRARQTAEPLWRHCNPLAELKMVRGLGPDDSPKWIHEMLDADDRDLVVVSHMPLLPPLARLFSADVNAFPLHGLIVLARTEHGAYTERWRAEPPG